MAKFGRKRAQSKNDGADGSGSDASDTEGGDVEVSESKTNVKPGDYQVQVHIIEARDLKPRESGGYSDPVTVVTCFEQKQSTAIRKKTLSCIWDQVLFFEKKISVEELDTGKALIAVYDANAYTKDVMIGAIEMDLMPVYERKNHEHWRKWYPLTDITDENEGVQGYLKLSVTILGPGDEQVSHEDDDEDDDDVDMKGLAQEGYLLKIQAECAESLPRMDRLGKGCDAYVGIKFAGNPLVKSEIVKSLDPVFHEELHVPVMLPTMSDKVEVQLYDWDRGSSDDLIATNYVKFSKLQKNGMKPRWLNLYGSPRKTETEFKISDKKHKKVKELMDKGKLEGSAWRGRVLLSATVEKEDEPKMSSKGEFKFAKVEQCPWFRKDGSEGLKRPEESSFTLRFDVFEGSEIPKNGDIHIELSIGNFVVKTKAAKSSKGCCQWYQSITETDIRLPANEAERPDLFVDLYKGSDRLAYQRYKLSSLPANPEAPRWELFKADVFGGLSENDFPGAVLYAIGFRESSDPFLSANFVEPPPANMTPPRKIRYELRAMIYQGRDLPAADDDGSADPFIIVKCAGEEGRTSRREGTLHPAWYETVRMNVDLYENVNLSPDIQLLVYDWDRVGTNDFLGRVSVPIRDAISFKAGDKPKWYPVTINTFGKTETEGEILASFQVMPVDVAGRTPMIDIRPEMKDVTVRVVAVGVRKMEPYKFSKIKKPHVELDLGQRAKKDEDRIRTKKSSKPEGPNANFLEVFEIPAKVPRDPLYAQTVNVRVFDNRKIPPFHPLIGTASIPLAPYLERRNEQLEEFVKKKEAEQLAAEMEAEAKHAAAHRRQEHAAAAQPLLAPDDDVLDQPNPFTQMGSDDDEAAPAAVAHDDAAGAGAGGAGDVELGAAGQNGQQAATGAAAERTVAAANARVEQPRRGERRDSNALRTFWRGALSKVKSGAKFLPIDTTHSDSEDDDEDVDDTPEYLKGRPVVDDELEDTMGDPIFDSFTLQRGQVRGKAFGKGGIKKVGTFKGMVAIIDKELDGLKPEWREEFAALQKGPDTEQILKPQPYVVRAYILKGKNFVPKDDDGTSDPYLIVELGKKKNKDRERVIKNTLQPEFHYVYEMNATLPGTSQLHITAMDWDAVSSDDLIGSTTVDVENRWFSQEWQQLAKENDGKVPVETRSLWNPTSTAAQGKMTMWIEIIPKAQAPKVPLLDISLPPPESFEFRMVVYRARKMVPMDSITKMNDLYITATLEAGADRDHVQGVLMKEETDVHWRAGKKGSFNWRMKYEITLPMKMPRLKISAWDADLIGGNDMVGEKMITRRIRKMFKRVLRKHREGLTGLQALEARKRHWIHLRHPDRDGSMGELEVEYELMHKTFADSRPNGKGRQDPNAYPTLPPPDRIKFNPLRPDKMLMALLGPELVTKCCMVGCCILVLVGLAMMVPLIFSNLISSALGA